MKLERYCLLFIMLFCFIFKSNGQNVSLQNQFNGRFDFTFIGNTLNINPNGANDPCLLLPSSDAILSLGPNDVIEKAYLFWAGSGTGDFEVKLNGIDIASQHNFLATQNSSGFPFFSAYADVTTQLQTTGNGTYTLSDLDVSPFLNPDTYCINGTNFSGWAIVIVYKNDALPFNQINVYYGLETLSTAIIGVQDQLIINLGNLNVLDNSGAKLGFVAWEGDASIANQETLLINGHPLTDTLNPADNAFNGTNNIIGSSTLYNMDLDIFDIQNSIAIGNTSATITMTTAQDFVLMNTIVTKLNSQLPDATVAINAVDLECDSRTITVHYTVSNLNATNPLPAGTPIAIYVNGVFTAFDETTLPIAVGASTDYQITITIPNTVPLDFELKIAVDDSGTGTGTITELNETNNTALSQISLWVAPEFNIPENLIVCNEGFTKGTFDFSNYQDLVRINPRDSINFYETSEDALLGINPILNTTNFQAIPTPKEIFVKITNAHCTAITSFLLKTRNCPPTVYNYVSANNDTYNESFTIEGLQNIFLNFKLEIYNRWGRLVWVGNNNTENWNGYIKDGVGSTNAPDGTYFYLLFLNDIDYPEPLKGFLYLNH